jgi:hypothetical protein
MSGPKDVHRTKTKRERVLEVMQTPEYAMQLGRDPLGTLCACVAQ